MKPFKVFPLLMLAVLLFGGCSFDLDYDGYARGVVFLETLGMNALNEEIFPHSASYRK